MLCNLRTMYYGYTILSYVHRRPIYCVSIDLLHFFAAFGLDIKSTTEQVSIDKQ